MSKEICDLSYIFNQKVSNKTTQTINELMSVGIIYVFTNTTNNKKYVGQTWYVKRRIKDHFKGNGYAKLLKYAINKYGTDKFEVDIIDYCDSQTALDEKEINYIAELGSLIPNGYNISTGGSTGKHCEATKKLIGSYQKNKVLSSETREKIRNALKGRHLSEDLKKTISANMKQHFKDTEKPIYIFNALTHILVDTYKNISTFKDEYAELPYTRVYGSLYTESSFDYKQQKCYARFSSEPLDKTFVFGRKVIVTDEEDNTYEFTTLTEATKQLGIKRGIMDALVRNLCKRSKYIKDGRTLFFTAKYA